MSKDIEPVAYVKNGYKEKFGIPRQSGLANSIKSQIVFCEKYKDENMLREIEQYSHLWLIWGFSENGDEWSPTVRPPKLGGNKRVGVFATRSPFRPNGLGLSCVKLDTVENSSNGKILVVSGCDLQDNTPIYDIKPYLPYVDSIPDANGGFSDEHKEDYVKVSFNENLKIQDDLKLELKEILSLDPKPQYHSDEDRVYGFNYKDYEIKFVSRQDGITVLSVE